jgi:dTDP-4-amino-4,6-dideoxygalactose transaminase
MGYRIPLFKLNYGIEEEDAVLDTLRSKWISTGPKCEELEKLFSEKLNVKYALSVANCTAALHLACTVLGITAGDEVLCPSLTFAATANSITYTGARPVFVDITGIDDLSIDPSKIIESISSKTKAIMVMHYAGYPCNMDEICKIAEEHNLFIIEDACHGPLSEYHGRKLGAIGDIGCFSFFSNKNISTGEGGMIVTNNEELYRRMKLLRSHGMTTMSYQRAQGHATEYDIVDIGYNYRMDDIRASLAVVQMKKLEDDLNLRMEVRKKYINGLSMIDGIVIPYQDVQEFSSNYIFPIVIKNSTKENRNKVRDKMHEYGIQTSIHYPAIHRFSAYREFTRALPVTEYVADNEFTIPMYASLKDEEIQFIYGLHW